MPEFFVLLLMQVTVFSSVTALILIAVKQIFKCRIPPRIGVVLWIILLARLVCPVFPESEISVYNYIPIGKSIMFSLTNNISDEISEREELRRSESNPYVVTRKEGEPADTPVKDTDDPNYDVITVGEYFAEVVDDAHSSEKLKNSAERINVAIIAVYLVGSAAALTFFMFLYRRSVKRALASSEACVNEKLLGIYKATAVRLGIREEKIPPLRCGTADMLIGCRGAQIICREDMKNREAEMVFTHELLHYKCLDNPIILFSTIVACLFWYNPLIWIVRSILREDLEILCDARTLEQCSITRAEYAMMLCGLSSYARIVDAGCGMSAKGRRLKNRLKTISIDKHRRFGRRVASVFLCAAIMVLCLTNPIVSQNSDYSVYIENYAKLTGDNVRAMHLYNKETVSTYLSQLSTLLEEWYGEEYSKAIGRGSLERFKRICASSDNVPNEAASEVQRMITDEPLTVRNCAVISDCVTRLTASESNADGYRLLPERLRAADMDKILSNLTQTEADALLKCYNRGVAGAIVSFEMLYTDAMMDLICERISTEWYRSKLSGFYREYDLISQDPSTFSSAFLELTNNLRLSKSVYICDSSITQQEIENLSRILGAAEAGEQEDVYYLKKIEDGCPFDVAERLIRRSGFTHEEMIAGYAEIGEHSPASDSGYTVLRVRSDHAVISGTVRYAVQESAARMYTLGLLDSDNGKIDVSERLSCGQGIAYAYRLVSAMVPIN